MEDYKVRMKLLEREGVIKRGFILTEIESLLHNTLFYYRRWFGSAATHGTCKYLPKGAPQNREPSSKSDRDRLSLLPKKGLPRLTKSLNKVINNNNKIYTYISYLNYIKK